MAEISLQDQRHFDAALGWLGLGNWEEANEELEKIAPQFKALPEVLAVRFDIFAKAAKWEYAAEIARCISELLPHNPYGHIQLAFALHELKRTKDAYHVLVAVVDKFPDEHLIRYNLACYSCQLGNLKEAYLWLEKTIDVPSKKDIRKRALEDRDLEPLWLEIGKATSEAKDGGHDLI